MGMITLTINDKKVQVEEGSTILEAAQKAGIYIPTLCYLEEINIMGACRLCVVEVEGAKTLQASCVTPAAEGMVVRTNTPFLRKARKAILELLLSDHPFECLTCIRSGNCELQKLAEEFNIREIPYHGEKSDFKPDTSTPSIIRDTNKCILCRRCISACSNVQRVGILYPNERGFKTFIGPPFGENLKDMPCALCGQCVLACPTGALHEKEDIDEVWKALEDPNKHVIVQTAPAIRVSVGEAMGMDPGSIVTGKMVAALRRLGFDRVFDTDFAADLTIMEEGHEFLDRLKNGGKLPLMTSCSPGWVKFCEHHYPDFLENISTCKSPQQMFGALAKTYYANKMRIDPKNIFVVSIMPCTAKKFECKRPEMTDSGYLDVDVSLTVREVAKMFKQAGINFDTLPEEEFDAPLGISTGAAAIFGATGGVMEAALRTVYEVVTGETLQNLDFEDVRGLKGVKEASVNLPGITVKVAVAHGLANARDLLDQLRSGEKEYHFIEIMACPGGCIGGGGQPIPTNTETRKRRIEAIYNVDKNMAIRKSHENPAIKKLYKEFLIKPLGHKSHELLHTEYYQRIKY
ncbi:NADP-reducing hydrogenase subunit HndD [Koleobacter methoxysyntrophicus]|jgi:iron-only hydrogenase group A|uniref:NADP-reducing hydrogenase subunit HndD n=1 Tax=Koleobacter methoxysyntrophicus TaxID=2751313 RepID=A0A8A0RPK7_9FIRM|nr:NADH-dependent [FeFe] hydrogenase, group A6 [Koleobacter methoxysyntrophicus]QSQ09510.1 NADP-reducing hydrogenase subunit HndD [Koleobacter methoxysyntrophicus]